MPKLIVPGLPYRSRQALERIKGLIIGDQSPHVTPDGFAVLAPHYGGDPPGLAVDGQSVGPAADPGHCFHVLRDDGRNLEHVVSVEGRLEVRTVKIPIDGLGDLERLVEYDHLPESRKDYTVYSRGHKLA